MVHRSLFIDNSKSSIILERSGNPLGELPIMSIENPTLSAAADLAHFRHFSSLFTTKFPSTSVENPLQISYFLCKTNPILSAVGGLQMNVNLYIIEDYENETAFRPKKTNPNKPNFFKGQNKLNIACQKIRPHPREFGRRFIVAFILVRMVQLDRIALQVYISHTITNRTGFFTRKGQLR